MTSKRAGLAAAVAILLLSVGIPPVPADDDKAPSAKPVGPQTASPPGEKAIPPDRLKSVLSEVARRVKAMGEESDKEKQKFLTSMPSPSAFAMRFTPELQADTYRAIGLAQARVGDVPSARSSWQAALEASEGISSLDASGDRAKLLIAVAEAQLAAGERDEVRFTLRQAVQAARSGPPKNPFGIDLPMPPGFGDGDPISRKSGFLRQIASLQARAGDESHARETFNQALEAANSVKMPLSRIEALTAIGASGPADPAWTRALDVAMALPDFPRAHGVDAILRARIKAGQIDPALATIADRLKDDIQHYAIYAVADAIARSDAAVSPQAMERLERLAAEAKFDRPSKRIKVFRRLAEAYARLGSYEAAFRVIGQHQPANNVQTFTATQARIHVMTAVAHAQLKARQMEAARDTVHAALELIAPLPDEDADAYFPLFDLGDTLAQAGDFAGALNVAEGVGAAQSKVHILVDVAVAQFQKGKADDARATIRRAVEIAKRAPNDAVWAMIELPGGAGFFDPIQDVRVNISRAQATIGDVEAAFKNVAELGTETYAPFSRKALVDTIVAARIEAGDFAAARRAVNLIPPMDQMFQDDRVDLLERVARAHAQKQNPATLFEWADQEQSARGKLQVYRGLATGIADRFEPRTETARPGEPARPATPRVPGP